MFAITGLAPRSTTIVCPDSALATADTRVVGGVPGADAAVPTPFGGSPGGAHDRILPLERVFCERGRDHADQTDP